MNSNSSHIVWQDSKVTKEDRQKANGHKSCVLWFTGLSGAGKSTLAIHVEKELFNRRIRSFILDGDNIRHGLNQNLSFSPEDRSENIRRIGEVSKLFVDAGMITLVASISPYRADRDLIRSLFAAGEFIEVYVKCAIAECERRDPKGLYKKSKAGAILDFTGVSAPYEAPLRPEMIIESDKLSVDEAGEQLLRYLQSKGYLGV